MDILEENIKDEKTIDEEVEIEKPIEDTNDSLFAISDILTITLIGFFVCYGWQLLEKLMIGEIRPNNVDTVIGLILTYSLYLNYKYFKRYKKNK